MYSVIGETMDKKSLVKECCAHVINNSKKYTKMQDEDFLEYIYSNGLPELIDLDKFDAAIIQDTAVQKVVAKQRQKFVKKYLDTYIKYGKVKDWTPPFFHGTDARYIYMTDEQRIEMHDACEKLIDYLEPHILRYVLDKVPLLKELKIFIDAEKTAKIGYVMQVESFLKKLIINEEMCIAVTRLFFRHKNSTETEGMFLTSSKISALQYTTYGNPCSTFGIVGINALMLWNFVKCVEIEMPALDEKMQHYIDLVLEQTKYPPKPMVILVSRLSRDILLNPSTGEDITNDYTKQLWLGSGNVKLKNNIILQDFIKLDAEDFGLYNDCHNKLSSLAAYRKNMLI